MNVRHFVLLAATLLLTGCMTYRDFPVDMVGKAPPAKPYQALSYRIAQFDALSFGGGEEALKQVLRKDTPFRDTEAVEEMPEKGVFCLIHVEQKPVPLSVVAAGYLSYSTLGITPAWSTKDGMRIRYDLYIDGQRQGKYEYEITRKSAMWLGLLPFIWVNALTYSEAEAVQATAWKFFQDSDPLLAAYQARQVRAP
ncbi:MAG: hypothetical protein ACOY33_02765 [Pseudomonadota bacterium]